MNRLDRLAISAKTKMTVAKDNFKTKMANKEFGDSQIVVALILIVVALGLAIIFRNEVNKIITNIAKRVSEAVNGLANGAVDPHTAGV